MEESIFYEKVHIRSYFVYAQNNTLKIKYNCIELLSLCCTYPLIRPYTYLSQATLFSFSFSLSSESDYYYANKMLREIKGMTNNRNHDLYYVGEMIAVFSLRVD